MHGHRIDKISVKAGFFSSDLHKDKKKKSTDDKFRVR